MKTTNYEVQELIKTTGYWKPVTYPVSKKYARKHLREHKNDHPDHSFRLVKIEINRTVIK